MSAFFRLTPDDQGRTVEIGGRVGWLFLQQNPAYRRIRNVHWWLSIPNERFGRVHLSLEWVNHNTEVTFLEAEPVHLDEAA